MRSHVISTLDLLKSLVVGHLDLLESFVTPEIDCRHGTPFGDVLDFQSRSSLFLELRGIEK